MSLAQWRPATLRTRRGPLELARAELLISERKLAERFEMTRRVARGLLKRLVSLGFIVQRRHQWGTILTIVNYEQYQGSAPRAVETEIEAGTSEVPPMDQSGTKNKNSKKLRRVEEGSLASLARERAGKTGVEIDQPELLPTADIVSLPTTDLAAIAMSAWNAFASEHGLAPVDMDPRLQATHLRRPRLLRLLREVGGQDGFHELLTRVAVSPFLLGGGSSGWKVTLDWLTKPLTASRVMSGEFPADNPRKSAREERAAAAQGAQAGFDMLLDHLANGGSV